MARCWRSLLILLILTAAAGGQDEPRGDRRDGDGPGDFLRRLDANGNGAIDPEESQGRAGFSLRRIAENNPAIDLSQPVPLEKLEQAAAAARERWEVTRGGDRRDGAPATTHAPGKPAARLVPGFGEAQAATDVPGFGLLSKAVAALQVTDRDRAEAQRRFGYYDRNNDGVLEGEEMERARSRDYDEYDSNGDGKLTVGELAVRYAKRRVEEEAAAKAAASSSSSSPRRDEDRGRSESASRSGSSASRASAKSSPAKIYRVAGAEERLAKKGLPSWFLDKDADGDGQVAMAEYGESWSDGTIAEFARFDLSGDGVITPAECLQAVKSSGASRSTSPPRIDVAKADPPKSTPTANADDGAVDELKEADAENPAAEPEAAAGKPAVSAPVEIDPRYLSYAQGRIKQVDANSDGVLQPGEWIHMSKSPAAADLNGDQQITPEELAAWLMKR